MTQKLTGPVWENIVRASNEAVLVLDAGTPEHRILFANPAAWNLLGLGEAQLIDEAFPVLETDSGESDSTENLVRALDDRRPHETTLRHIRRDGSRFTSTVRVQPISDEEGESRYLAVFLTEPEAGADDVAAAKKPAADESSLKLADLVRDENLTGIVNRRYFEELLNREWAVAGAEDKTVSVFLMDIDHFDRYNKTFGRQAADSCLRLVAKAVSGALRRASDIGVRYGGEEFAALAAGMTVEQAGDLGGRIAERVHSLCIHHPKSKVSKYVTISVGVATASPTADLAPHTVIEAAENALADAKEAGRNRVVSVACEPGD